MTLVALSSQVVGRISFAQEWRSPGVRVVAASAFSGEQETLLLMPKAGEVTTERGTWRLEWINTTGAKPALSMIRAAQMRSN
jgi:hypothetical protein